MVQVPYSTLKSRLKTDLRDPSGITWLDGELDECLTVALTDPRANTMFIDNSLRTISGQNAYDYPDGMDRILEIYLDINGDGAGVPIDRGNYKLMEGDDGTGQIVFDLNYTRFPVGVPIIVHGIGPYYVPDGSALTNVTIPDYAVSFVTKLAKVEAYNMLRTKLMSGFLKNEISMAEIITSIRESKAEVIEAANRLPNKRTVAL